MLTTAELDQIRTRLDFFFQAIDDAGNAALMDVPQRAQVAHRIRVLRPLAYKDFATLLADCQERSPSPPG